MTEPRAKRLSPNVVYVGDPTPLGEVVVACGTGPRATVIVESLSDHQRLAVTYGEVHRGG